MPVLPARQPGDRRLDGDANGSIPPMDPVPPRTVPPAPEPSAAAGSRDSRSDASCGQCRESRNAAESRLADVQSLVAMRFSIATKRSISSCVL